MLPDVLGMTRRQRCSARNGNGRCVSIPFIGRRQGNHNEVAARHSKRSFVTFSRVVWIGRVAKPRSDRHSAGWAALPSWLLLPVSDVERLPDLI
jgi:hypothetical protein